MAWAVFVAALAGVLLWLNGTAEDTVSDLYARADKEGLRTTAELSVRPGVSEAEPAPDELANTQDQQEPEQPSENVDVTQDSADQTGDDGTADAVENATPQSDQGESGTVTAEIDQPDSEDQTDLPSADVETDDGSEPASQTALEAAPTDEVSAGPTAAAGLQPEEESPVEDLLADEGTEEAQLALVEPPAPELSEELDQDLPPWQANSRPFDAPASSPRIAIVITDLGLSAAATQIAIQDLPGEITLAFAAHAPDLDTWIPQTRAAGHEALVMVPMEPEDYPVSDPGPYTLLTSQAPSTNIDRLDWSLRRATGFVGIIDTKGSRFTSVADAVQPVVEEIGNRGLLVLDSGSEASVMPAVARETQVPVTASDAFITDFASGNAIDLRLAELEAIAQDNGSAVGVAFPYPILFDRLKGWIEGLDDKGIVLAPITAVVVPPDPE